MTPDGRTLIGKYSSLASREAIYEAADGFDVETREGYEVVERRVLYDDVMFVTYHRQYGAAYLITTGLISLFFLTIALIVWVAGDDTLVAALIVGALGLPAFISFCVRLFFGVDTITIFGRRSKASISFRLRKRRARAAYERICARVRASHQAASAAEDRPDDVAGTLPV